MIVAEFVPTLEVQSCKFVLERMRHRIRSIMLLFNNKLLLFNLNTENEFLEEFPYVVSNITFSVLLSLLNNPFTKTQAKLAPHLFT